MSTYGRNFEFRIPPEAQNRPGRYVTPATGTPIPIGAPIIVDQTVQPDSLGRQTVKLAVVADTPAVGDAQGGICVYEFGPAAFRGFDPWLTTFSDLGAAPLGRAVQMVSSREVKFLLRNTVAEKFLNTRVYPGRVMVAGLGATPTLDMGDFVAPGIGDDVNGYWEPVSTQAEGWAVVTLVDSARGEVELRMLF